MEGQILRYYLGLFSLFFIFYLIFIIFFKNVNTFDDIIKINKGENTLSISNKITYNYNYFDKNIFKLIILFTDKYYKPINYGQFIIKKNSNFLEILKLITEKSNYDYKITIIEGWEKYQLDNYLSSYYEDYKTIPYTDLIANTYIINSSNSILDLKEHLEKYKKNFFDKYKDNKLLKKYGVKNILILSSLVEKEAKNKDDKLLISSVILNRLNKNMKLQIDASVIASLTEGKFKLNRSLTTKDLKYDHPLNTYIIKGIPEEMICYVGQETVELLLENPKSNFLFYFFNILENKHIFSKNYESHRKQLNEYRKKIK